MPWINLDGTRNTRNKPGKATNLSDKNCQLHDCKERGQAKVLVAQKLIAKIV